MMVKLTSDAECPGKLSVERHDCVSSHVCGYLRSKEMGANKRARWRFMRDFVTFSYARYKETSRRLSFMWGRQ